jgi:hypothetical protein
MPDGVAVSRQFVRVTQKGNCVVDWGRNIFQDIYTGEKIDLDENEYTYIVKESELMMLKQYGIIKDFDQHSVYVYPMNDIYGF